MNTHTSYAGSGWPVLPSLTERTNGVSLGTYVPLNNRRRWAWLEGLCSTRGGPLGATGERVLLPVKPGGRSQALSDMCGDKHAEMDVRRRYGLPSISHPPSPWNGGGVGECLIPGSTSSAAGTHCGSQEGGAWRAHDPAFCGSPPPPGGTQHALGTWQLMS